MRLNGAGLKHAANLFVKMKASDAGNKPITAGKL